MPKKKEEGNFFVGIEDSTDIKRDVLEATRGVVEIMQKYEKFKEARTKKMNEIEKLKKTISDINKLNTRLKSVLPKTPLRIPHGIETKKEEKVTKPVEESKHFESLDKDLKEIEDKLSKLER